MSVEALENYHRLLAEGKLEESAALYGEVNDSFNRNMHTIKALCKRFGTSYLAPDRDEKITAGVQRVIDEHDALVLELAELKEKHGFV